MILLKKPDTRSITFILPNDEGKYYFSSMADDLGAFLTMRGHQFNQLDIRVQCFKYGDQVYHRPYNCPSKTIHGKKKLDFSYIINEQSIDNAVKNSCLTSL